MYSQIEGVFELDPVKSMNTTKIASIANHRKIKLTSAEMGKLSVTYVLIRWKSVFFVTIFKMFLMSTLKRFCMMP